MTKFENPIIFLNKNAQGGKIFKKLQYFKEKIDKFFGKNVSCFVSESLKNTEEQIEKICKSKEFDLIISIGGDGTLSSFVNNFMKFPEENRLPIFPIPGGSGNSLFLDFGFSDINGAFEKITDKENLSNIDILKVKSKQSTFYCINILGMGFISDVAEFAVTKKKTFGDFSYVFAPFFGLKNFKPYKTKITYRYNNDIKEINFEKIYFLTISNNKYTGAKFKIAPEAKVNDGVFDIVILHDINRLEFLNGFIKTFSGKHINQKGCEYIKADYVKIESEPEFKLMPDGDLYDTSPVEVELLKDQIKLAIKL